MKRKGKTRISQGEGKLVGKELEREEKEKDVGREEKGGGEGGLVFSV